MRSQFVIGFQDIPSLHKYITFRALPDFILCRRYFSVSGFGTMLLTYLFSVFPLQYLFLQINNISFFKSQPWGFPFSWENQENVSRFSNGVIPKEQISESHHFLETMVSAVCYRKNIVTNLILFRFWSF